MHESVRTYLEKHTRKLGAGSVLEVGALDINGGVRDLFPDAAQYLGVDLDPGPGVDLIADAHELDRLAELHNDPTMAAGTFDLVLCLEMLEHDYAPWLTVEQLARMVRPGGTVIVTARGNGFPEHNRPDLWRFMRDGMRSLLENAGLTVKRLDTDPQVAGWLAVCTRPKG